MVFVIISRNSSRCLVPYGKLALSAKYSKFSWGISLLSSRMIDKEPIPESNTQIGLLIISKLPYLINTCININTRYNIRFKYCIITFSIYLYLLFLFCNSSDEYFVSTFFHFEFTYLNCLIHTY